MILRSTRKLDLAINDLCDAYAAAGTEPDLGRLISQYDLRDIDSICDLVEADVRERMERSLAVPLGRYLGEGCGVPRADELIDTVIDLAIQARVCSGQSVDEAARELSGERPDLKAHVEDARALGEALSMSGLGVSRKGGAHRPEAPVPAELGAVSDGRARYEILNPIGKGAFGQVFRALDRALTESGHRAEVAIKVLDLVDGASLIEASRARRVRHPSIVRVYDHGALPDGRSYIVYELVEGQTLRERVEQSGPLPIRDAVALMASVVEGVHAAHGVQVLHRDLNPGNILIDRTGAPRVTDFGAAVGMDALPDEPMKSRPLGAPGFIAPEQWRGEGTESVQTDVFGLGALLFYAITGKCPNGATLEEARAFLEDSADRRRLEEKAMSLPRDLRLILLRSLAADPAERHHSAAQLAEDLRSWLVMRPIAWTRPGPLRRTALLVRRRPLASAAASLGVVLVVASMAFASLWLGRILQQQRDGSAWRASMGGAIAKLRNEGQIAGIAAVTIVMDTLAPESIMRAFLDPENTAQLRITAFSRLSLLSESHLGAHDPRTRLYRSAEALARLTEQAKRADTLAFVQSVRDEWKALLPPDSIWLREMELWVDCAHTKEIFHKYWQQPPPVGADAQALREIARRLEAGLSLFTGWLDATPTKRLIVRALTHIYGKGLLNQPEDLERVRAIQAAPSDPSVQPTGVLNLL
jgi:hypothetical protein